MTGKSMKITGLSRFHCAALKKSFTNTNLTGADLKIEFNDKISLKRMSSYWYGGNVADVIYKGYTFHVETAGDVRVCLFSKNGGEIHYVKDTNNAGVFKHEMFPYFRSDKVLNQAAGNEHSKYELTVSNNNYWECFVTDPQGNFHDLMWVLDAGNVFEAVEETLENLSGIIKYIEEAAA